MESISTTRKSKARELGSFSALLLVFCYALFFHASLVAAYDADQQLFEAILKRDIAAVNQAIQAHANVNAQQPKLLSTETPLILAITLDELEIAKLLVEHGANLDEHQQGLAQRTPLAAAVYHGSHDMVSLLIAHGADVNQQGGMWGNYSPLYLATKSGNLPMVQQLLDAGAKIIPSRWSNFKEALATPWYLLQGRFIRFDIPPSLLEAAKASGNSELLIFLQERGAR